MATYSKYTGNPWQSFSSPLILATASDGAYPFMFTINEDYEDLISSTSSYIIPKYLRDAVLSIWDSIPFKETTASGSNTYYIGIDSGAADNLLEKPNRDLNVNKILIGKRSYSGTQSYTMSHDIMTTQLIESDVDIYFYNTRTDISSQQSTRIGFLAGAESALHPFAPYIQNQVVTSPGGTNSSSLDFVAPNGNIYVMSKGQDNTGADLSESAPVSVNDIVFPSIGTSSVYQKSFGTDKKNLIWKNGELAWEQIEFPLVSSIGITGSGFEIHGDVAINYHPIEFSDNRYVSSAIGDIALGSTFRLMSVADVIRKIVYSYLAPSCTLSLSLGQSQYLEVGTYPTVSLDYSITKMTNATKPTRLINMIPGTLAAISNPGQSVVNGQARGVVITPLMATSSSFTIKVTDGENYNIATTSVFGIYPYFYGFTSSNVMNISTLSTMQKSVEPKGDKSHDITGSGNFFFAYDADYGPLSQILDPSNTNIISSFSSNVKMISSPTGLWASKQYRVYLLEGMPQVGPPSENYEFKY
jgi:hypothetical protein